MFNALRFDNGLTIKELKEILKDLPEENTAGEPFKVWIETGWCMSSEVKEVWPLDRRDDGQDIILQSDSFEKP